MKCRPKKAPSTPTRHRGLGGPFSLSMSNAFIENSGQRPDCYTYVHNHLLPSSTERYLHMTWACVHLIVCAGFTSHGSTISLEAKIHVLLRSAAIKSSQKATRDFFQEAEEAENRHQRRRLKIVNTHRMGQLHRPTDVSRTGILWASSIQYRNEVVAATVY